MNTINHMNWAMGQMEYLRDVQSSGKADPAPLTTAQEIEQLQRLIAQEQDTILRYASRPLIVSDALEDLREYELRLAALERKQVAEAIRAACPGAEYPAELLSTTRAVFMAQVQYAVEKAEK